MKKVPLQVELAKGPKEMKKPNEVRGGFEPPYTVLQTVA